MMGLMADKRFLITITEFDETCLSKDLPFAEVPHAVGQCLDGLSAHGAFDTQKVYLLEPDQKEQVQRVLEHCSLPYPELIRNLQDAARPAATVVNIHDRRQRTQNPGNDPRAS